MLWNLFFSFHAFHRQENLLFDLGKPSLYSIASILEGKFFYSVCLSLKKVVRYTFLAYASIFCIFRPVLVLLLLSMVNEKQPFELRCAILYCLQSYLHKNPTRQKEVMRTLLPQQESVASDGGKVIKLMGKIKSTVYYTRQITDLFLARYIRLYALGRSRSNLLWIHF